MTLTLCFLGFCLNQFLLQDCLELGRTVHDIAQIWTCLHVPRIDIYRLTTSPLSCHERRINLNRMYQTRFDVIQCRRCAANEPQIGLKRMCDRSLDCIIYIQNLDCVPGW